MGEVAVGQEPQVKLNSSGSGGPQWVGEAAPPAGTPASPCPHQRESAQLLPHLWSDFTICFPSPHCCRATLSPQNKSVSMETIQ